jgi:hypothetical protein
MGIQYISLLCINNSLLNTKVTSIINHQAVNKKAGGRPYFWPHLFGKMLFPRPRRTRNGGYKKGIDDLYELPRQ